MEPTSLERLKEVSKVTLKPDGIVVTVLTGWIIKGENRLSYTTITRLVECCREHHWNNDIAPINKNTDTITKNINADFIKPIFAGSTIYIQYKIIEVFQKSYVLGFEIKSKGILHAIFKLVLIFYDSKINKSTVPSLDIIKKLKILLLTYTSEKTEKDL